MSRYDFAFISIRLIALYDILNTFPGILVRLLAYIQDVLVRGEHFGAGNVGFDWALDFNIRYIVPMLISILLAAAIWIKADKVATYLSADNAQ